MTMCAGYSQTRDRPVYVDNDRKYPGHIPVYMTPAQRHYPDEERMCCFSYFTTPNVIANS